MVDRKRSRRFRTIGLIALGLIIATSLLVYSNRQLVSDTISASQYQATPEMQSVIDRISLTSAGDRIFRASHPTLNASESFNENCSGVEHSESDLIIGCYDGDKIHLFEITDERLDGIVEVTSAHELLHAQFDRLSTQEKTQLAAQLRQEFDVQAERDPALGERMKVYEHLSPESFANELHSVLGTEVSDLSPELEKHYAAVFRDRSAIVGLFQTYNARFVEINRQRTELASRLESLGQQIEAARSAYEAGVERFNADSQSLITRNNNFEFANNPSLFYSLRDELSTRRAALESERVSLNSTIDDYNRLREELLAIDATAQDLIRAIDSNVVPAE